MKREEAIDILFGCIEAHSEEENEALDMAIEALEREPQKKYPTEWCEQCTLWENNKCVGVAQCKRNIEALKPLMNDDLISRAEAIEAIELVDWYHQNSNKDMVHGANDDEHQAWYKAQDIYKALEAVPSANRPTDGDLISRAEAIEAITGTLDAIDHVPKWVFDKLTCAINILPSADRPTDGDLISRADAIEALGEEPLVRCDENYEIAERNQWRADVEVIKSVPSADRVRPIDPTIEVDLESGVVPISACAPKAPKTIVYESRIYESRPKGRWHYSDGKPATIGQSFGVICDQCGAESEYCTNFCGECGADMRGETDEL